MRTTLNIDEDLLVAVKELARRESSSAGAVVSRLLRRSLAGAADGTAPGLAEEQAPLTGFPAGASGFRPFPKRGGVVTNALIDRLRDETGT